MSLMIRTLCATALAWLACGAAAAPVSVQDDDGRTVSLPAPARRIVSLAPHTTELLFDAGAGAQVVATVRYGDHPAAAKTLPVVGDAHLLDLERIAALKPDLIVVWLHGSAAGQIDKLRTLKIPLFHSEPRSLPQIGDSLRRLGVLAGTDAAAQTAAKAFDTDLARLRQRYSTRPPLRVFYQVWHQPLMTVNDQHLISDVIHLCGGVNVFGTQAALVPTVSAEAVLATRPQVLATSTLDGQVDDSIAHWRGFKAFEPIARQAVVTIPSDLISRHTPRILQGAQRMCEGFEQVRAGQPVKLPALQP
jgi:iron complex transport system substrate-binding protein